MNELFSARNLIVSFFRNDESKANAGMNKNKQVISRHGGHGGIRLDAGASFYR